jgi:hypothetical protein
MRILAFSMAQKMRASSMTQREDLIRGVATAAPLVVPGPE